MSISNNQARFEDEFCAVRDRIAYLDDIDTMLEFPRMFVAVTAGKRGPMRDLYFGRESQVVTVPAGGDLPIIELANRICSFHDDGEELEDQSWGEVARFIENKRPDYMKAIGLHASEMPLVSGEYRASAYEIVTLLNYGKPIADLWREADDGDINAFLKLVRIDKSAMTAGAGAELVQKKQLLGDWEFFKELAKAIRKHPIADKKVKTKAVILTARFWREELQSWSRNDLTAFLVEHDLLSGLHGSRESFLRTIRKLHLTKSGPGRPKKGT